MQDPTDLVGGESDLPHGLLRGRPDVNAWTSFNVSRKETPHRMGRTATASVAWITAGSFVSSLRHPAR